MAIKNTVFQALDKAINGNWQTQASPHVNNYDMSSIGDKIIYKTTDKADYEQKKLELKQDAYLKDRWVRANVNLSVAAYAGLGRIQLMYRDADFMDSMPEIGAALDIVSEESVLPHPIDGSIVNVYSKSDRVKRILEDLFVNRLNIQLTGQMVIRAMCKYGNQFMLLDVDHKNGVKGWKQLPVAQVERIENGIRNPYGSGVVVGQGKDVDRSTQFIWTDEATSTQAPFRDWQIAHFRLINNSMYLPYGVSFLNPARRHWRMLSLMEDMMFLYRLERSMERRVYKIFVGAIDDADVPAYIERVANEFKRTPIIDPQTGQVDLRKNILPVHKDTPIPLLDGRTLTIEQLAQEYNAGKENYVYSVQDETHQIVPGKVAWCGKNYTADSLLKITLDDGSHMIMAPEHEIIMRNGSKKRADEVKPGESVMPLYRGKEQIGVRQNTDYETVYNPSTGKYELTHRLVGKEITRETGGETVIHHKDFNRYNNSPSNLQWMTWEDHRNYHVSLNRTDRIRGLRKISSKNRWLKPEYREKSRSNMRVKFDDYVWTEIEKAVVRGEIYSQFSMIKYINENLVEYLKTINQSQKLHHNSKVTKQTVRARIREYGFSNCDEYLVSIEEKHGLQSHFITQSQEKSRRATEHNFAKNLGGEWKTKERLTEIYEQLSEKTRLKFDDYIWGCLREDILSGEITNSVTLVNAINVKYIDYIAEHKTSGKKINGKIGRDAIRRLIQREYNVESVNDYIAIMKKNHKVTSIEVVSGDDVYCMTVVGLNGEEDRHNFALLSWKEDGSVNDSGVFVSNCVDSDVFIPVRDVNAPNPIDTLAAGQNMTALDDIKYVQNKICAALRIPKSFLNFEEAAGDGKNLALMDIRFTRTINRIQQAFLMELTKIATIHLFLLGFDDELTNFTLSMNNPSTQAEQLEIENLQKKISAVRDAVSDPGTGIPPMSLVRALKTIMKWSEKDIKENFEEIRLEKGLAAELEKTTQIIKKTGIFDSVDRIYGEPGAEYMDDQQGGQGGMDGGPGGGGGPMGGGPTDFGSELDSMGDVGADDTGDIAGNEGAMPMVDMDAGTEAAAQPMESSDKKGNLIMDDLMKKYLNTLKEEKVKGNLIKRAEPHDLDGFFINEEIDNLRTSLQEFVKENEEKVG